MKRESIKAAGYCVDYDDPVTIKLMEEARIAQEKVVEISKKWYGFAVAWKYANLAENAKWELDQYCKLKFFAAGCPRC